MSVHKLQTFTTGTRVKKLTIIEATRSFQEACRSGNIKEAKLLLIIKGYKR